MRSDAVLPQASGDLNVPTLEPPGSGKAYYVAHKRRQQQQCWESNHKQVSCFHWFSDKYPGLNYICNHTVVGVEQSSKIPLSAFLLCR